MEPSRAETPSAVRPGSRRIDPAAPRIDPIADLCCVGLNHRTAPLEVRERFALAVGVAEGGAAGRDAALQKLVSGSGAREAVLVATCNRVELYADGSAGELVRFLCKTTQTNEAELLKHLYRHEGTEAVDHLFRVAASLDSLVLGEDQILNQVKGSYDGARRAGTVGNLLHPLFQAAIKAGKRVRRETEIGARMLSVSSIAVDFVQKVFSDLSQKSVLLVGAGDAARLTLVHLRARGVRTVRIANRSLENAQKLATELGGEAVSLESLGAELTRADVVLTSVGAPRPLVTEAMVAKAMKARHGRSLFLIDIAVPRDVEAAVEKLPGAFLYNLDDLQQIVRENYGKRKDDLESALRLVSDEVERHLGRERHRRLGPLVAEVLERVEAVTQDDVRSTLEKLATLSPEARAEVERLTDRLVRRILHAPLTAIREEARTGDDEGPQRFLERLIANLPPRPRTAGRDGDQPGDDAP